MIPYRREIDGLRALAVVPVVLFHAGFREFSGGFVGVDVFFVISGYLITSLLATEKESGTFSLPNFYERRARRILPALFFVMAACLPFAWLWLPPPAMKDFSQSLVAITGFASNILFWQESGYFQTAAELKPLLHTWSLAVEEQFYLLFPVLILALWPLGRRRLVGVLATVALASFLAAHLGVAYGPDATFFLLPTRAWELLAGALVALCITDGHRCLASRPVNEAASVSGIALILYAVVTYDDATPFPGAYALVPTLGTALVIVFARPATLVGRVLSSKPFVNIGLLSYSAYLWHQPLFAFARHQGAVDRSADILAGLCIASFVLAYLTWAFVETPFRSRGVVHRNAVFRYSIAGALLFASIGLAGHVTSGFESSWLTRRTDAERIAFELLKREKASEQQRHSQQAQAALTAGCRFNVRNVTEDVVERVRRCFSEHGKGLAVLGDSHAIDLFDLLSAADRETKFLVGFTRGFCRPHAPLPECQYEEFRQFVQRHAVFSTVIYEQAGFYLLRTKSQIARREIFSDVPLWRAVPDVYLNEPAIEATHRYLEELSRFVPVVWFGPRTEPHIKERDVLRLGCEHRYELRAGQAEAFSRLDDALSRRVGARGSLRYVSQNRMFAFQFPADFMTCDSIYWSDGDHFSKAGEAYFGRRLDISRLLGEGSQIRDGSNRDVQ